MEKIVGVFFANDVSRIEIQKNIIFSFHCYATLNWLCALKNYPLIMLMDSLNKIETCKVL